MRKKTGNERAARYVSIWLFRWRTDWRWRTTLDKAPNDSQGDGSLKEAPFALIATRQGGERLTAVNAPAADAGLSVGMLLTDAKALIPSLRAETETPESAAAGLEALAKWCARYTPFVALDAPDGLFLDITGCAHLFGGERRMLIDLGRRLRDFGLHARIACADTPGAAWAAARSATKPGTIIAPGRQREAIARYPVSGLRIDEKIEDHLGRLGLKRIGQLYGMPRGPLAARFGKALLDRLDAALGETEESLSPLQPVATYAARAPFPEPVSLLEDIERIAGRLAEKVAADLARDGKGARRFLLTLFGTDGSARTIEARSARLAFNHEKIIGLFRERIAALEAFYDPGVGVDAVRLEARAVEAVRRRQTSLDANNEDGAALSFLLDRIAARLGPRAVKRLAPVESHLPERAQQAAPAENAEAAIGAGNGAAWKDAPRPLLLLPQPEPVTVTAQIPDGPPAHFTWRRVRRRVLKADGPERIATEWWKGDRYRTRDYFRVEDEDHRRFWLYRDGLYDREAGTPQWFLHGIFP
ncbi:MAG: DNA polymerase Y family protein [Pseudomonadota bacterium]